MSIDFITEQPTLPQIDRNARRPEEIVEYLNRVFGLLQENLLRIMVEIINHQLSLNNTGVWYTKLPNPATGVYPDGTWRFIETGGNMELQKKIAGTWTKISLWAE